jgi:hypothetical protein
MNNKKTVSIIIIAALTIALLAVVYFVIIKSEKPKYPPLSEIYNDEDCYFKGSDLTATRLTLTRDHQMIFQYFVENELTITDTANFNYNEKTGFLSTKDWRDKYPFRVKRIRVMYEDKPVIQIGKSTYVRQEIKIEE